MNSFIHSRIPIPPIQFKPCCEQNGVKEQIRDPYDGIDLMDETIIKREETINKTIGIIERNKMTLIWAPPNTGKSSLGQLLQSQLETKYPNAYVRRLLWTSSPCGNSSSLSLEELWKGQTGQSIVDWIIVSFYAPVYLIMDECQAIYPEYNNNHEWANRVWPMIQATEGRQNIRFVVMSSTGDKVTYLQTQYISVGLICSSESSVNISMLNFKKEEYDQLIINKFRHTTRVGHEQTFPETTKEWIFENTDGHVGLLSRTIDLLRDKFKEMIMTVDALEPTHHLDQLMMEYLLSDDYARDISQSRAASPNLQTLSESHLHVLDSVACGHYPYNPQNRDDPISFLLEKGYLIRDNEVTVFPSPLHRNLYLLQRFKPPPPPTTTVISQPHLDVNKDDDDMDTFLVDCIRQFRPHQLTNKSNVHRSNVGRVTQPLEVIWQMEFYHAAAATCATMVPSTCIAPSSVARGKEPKRFTDFYIGSKYKWAIDMVCEGNNIDQHLQRFEKDTDNTGYLEQQHNNRQLDNNQIEQPNIYIYQQQQHIFSVITNIYNNLILDPPQIPSSLTIPPPPSSSSPYVRRHHQRQHSRSGSTSGPASASTTTNTAGVAASSSTTTTTTSTTNNNNNNTNTSTTTSPISPPPPPSPPLHSSNPAINNNNNNNSITSSSTGISVSGGVNNNIHCSSGSNTGSTINISVGSNSSGVITTSGGVISSSGGSTLVNSNSCNNISISSQLSPTNFFNDQQHQQQQQQQQQHSPSSGSMNNTTGGSSSSSSSGLKFNSTRKYINAPPPSQSHDNIFNEILTPIPVVRPISNSSSSLFSNNEVDPLDFLDSHNNFVTPSYNYNHPHHHHRTSNSSSNISIIQQHQQQQLQQQLHHQQQQQQNTLNQSTDSLTPPVTSNNNNNNSSFNSHYQQQQPSPAPSPPLLVVPKSPSNSRSPTRPQSAPFPTAPYIVNQNNFNFLPPPPSSSSTTSSTLKSSSSSVGSNKSYSSSPQSQSPQSSVTKDEVSSSVSFPPPPPPPPQPQHPNQFFISRPHSNTLSQYPSYQGTNNSSNNNNINLSTSPSKSRSPATSSPSPLSPTGSPPYQGVDSNNSSSNNNNNNNTTSTSTTSKPPNKPPPPIPQPKERKIDTSDSGSSSSGGLFGMGFKFIKKKLGGSHEKEPHQWDLRKSNSQVLRVDDRQTVSYLLNQSGSKGIARSSVAFSSSFNYFELSVNGKEGKICLGLTPADYPTDQFPGYLQGSYGYYGDGRREIFFTRNGVFLGVAYGNVYGEFYPSVAFTEPGTIEATFSPPFKYANIHTLVKEINSPIEPAISSSSGSISEKDEKKDSGNKIMLPPLPSIIDQQQQQQQQQQLSQQPPLNQEQELTNQMIVFNGNNRVSPTPSFVLPASQGSTSSSSLSSSSSSLPPPPPNTIGSLTSINTKSISLPAGGSIPTVSSLGLSFSNSSTSPQTSPRTSKNNLVMVSGALSSSDEFGFYSGSYQDSDGQPPSAWRRYGKSFKPNNDITVTMIKKKTSVAQANRPFPMGGTVLCYFEVYLEGYDKKGTFTVGLTHAACTINKHIGREPKTYGYASDGEKFSGTEIGEPYGPSYANSGEYTVIGCGYNTTTKEIFFTKNGQYLGVAFWRVLSVPLYPSISIRGVGSTAVATFSGPFKFNLNSLPGVSPSFWTESLGPDRGAGFQRWPPNDVAVWLEAIGYGQYRKNFRENNISGRHLLLFDHELLKSDLGIEPLGHRADILNRVQRMVKVWRDRENGFRIGFDDDTNDGTSTTSTTDQDSVGSHNDDAARSHITRPGRKGFASKIFVEERSRRSTIGGGENTNQTSNHYYPNNNQQRIIDVSKTMTEEQISRIREKDELFELRGKPFATLGHVKSQQQQQQEGAGYPPFSPQIGNSYPPVKPTTSNSSPSAFKLPPLVSSISSMSGGMQPPPQHIGPHPSFMSPQNIAQIIEQQQQPHQQSKDFEIGYDELEFGELLGKGFFGEVKKGAWRETDVAIKVIYRDQFKSKTSFEMFQNEVSIFKKRKKESIKPNIYIYLFFIYSKLRHPNVVQFLGACTSGHEDQHCIVIEWMGGGSLRQFLSDHFNILEENPQLRLKIALDIAKGMNCLHGWTPPILHRDLSSRNILIDNNINNLRGPYQVTDFKCKISDFGLSRLKMEQGDKMTGSVGCIPYMAPEVFRGEPNSEKSDVYSFSMILWELLTSEEPQQDLKVQRMAHLVAHEGYRPPIPLTTSPKWKQLIQLCWDADPEKRPTFSQIIKHLKDMEIQGISSFAPVPVSIDAGVYA
ncbi:non-receptor tyrosine kinase [Cavenderia fasciculata]|uniref:Non-receptor tyrosine kinase n=1 Tax=Cavenderia fasciculata TaxID=261658 RepID=F4PH28_CACFS|nr:non-receptor tyrosine kinase [Cavenderia fasciculata]EGG25012.1 non-receptor tyrosine kinase [Cavenderia fasciculata]|eukprot:XP_004362863.1 non-receptor tyrosine kinase [Cavenderia fasciculata]